MPAAAASPAAHKQPAVALRALLQLDLSDSHIRFVHVVVIIMFVLAVIIVLCLFACMCLVGFSFYAAPTSPASQKQPAVPLRGLLRLDLSDCP